MGSPSSDELLGCLAATPGTGVRFKQSFVKSLPVAWEKYRSDFDASYRERQERWGSLRFDGICPISVQWFGATPEFDVVEAC
jgi:hypothetical protein